MLLRYSSLVMDTIRFHRDYPVLCVKERAFSKKQLVAVIDELESLQAEVSCQVDGLNKGYTRRSLQSSAVNNNVSFESGYNQNRGTTQNKQSSPFDTQFQKLSLLPTPRQETLSRHSLLGPNVLRGQLLNPSTQIKVQYPTYTDLKSSDR
ncbi:AMSH-like ubiquitin thioesterase 3 [Rutidosis leptorrhynchoides]|uniref:AMSH-like ubiquitin thioesterase 3 n=1 Tax=Rutidosis leptorrhynchoides TaxID=125765 RepID=UPI003A9A3673